MTTKIHVGGGTCGLSTGANEVFLAFKEQFPEDEVLLVGCQGLCHQEVLVEIWTDLLGATKKYVYGKVKPSHVALIKSSFEKGPLLTEKELSFLSAQTRFALKNVGHIDPTSLSAALSRGAYSTLLDLVSKKISSKEIIERLKKTGLKGRGGGGFLTGQKWDFVLSATGDTKHIVCNGDEGDPGAFMDRSLLESDPHLVIEGMLIAAYTLKAFHLMAYIRAEYPLAVKHFQLAIDKLKEANIIPFDFTLEVRQGAGAFVCGEETALLASLEGHRGLPRPRPPFPAVSGFRQSPTLINNVETFANIPTLLTEKGAKEFSALGTEHSRGTKVFALAGAVVRGGLVEVPMGLTIRQLLDQFGGGSKTGRPFKAVQLGGPSGGCIPESLFDTLIDYQAIASTGAIMGSGGMIVLDESTCMVDLALYFLKFTQEESCGKCTFCRVGTLRMKELLEKITQGVATKDDLTLLEELASKIQKASLCGLGQTASNPVLTTLRYFRHEYEEHIHDKRCRAHLCRSLIRHEIDQSLCTACSLCQRHCGVSAIIGTPKLKNSYLIDAKRCVQCGRCVTVCPKNAVKVLS